jgi:cytochrome c
VIVAGRWLLALAVAGSALGAAEAARAEGPADPGARAFQKCYACHSVDPAERGLPGPNLSHVVGRPAAALPDFEYSDAMIAAARQRKLVWTEATLDRYLADPQAFVPGTAMNFFGLRNPAERAALIAYLARPRP